MTRSGGQINIGYKRERSVFNCKDGVRFLRLIKTEHVALILKSECQGTYSIQFIED